nr:murein biosynthesis integral membrane protein MurJ [Ardenticatena sp.]
MSVESPHATPATEPQPVIVPSRRGIARAASIISLGNIASRVLGLVRETAFANAFGASGAFSAFTAAAQIPMMIHDMLIGGLLSSALVPVFSEQTDDRETLWRIVSVVLGTTVVLVSLAVLLVELLAPWLTGLLVGGFSAELQALTTQLIRLVTPAVLLLSVAGVLTGLLYALKRFTFAAFGAAVYNIGMIVGAVWLTRFFDEPHRIYALALGMLLGAAGQVLLLLPDLRDQRVRLALDWRHPVLRHIGKLYLPIALGLVISHIGIFIDRNLASGTGEQSISWMRYATTLIQFPLGLIAAAVSLAVLPNLSQLASRQQLEAYRQTLFTGLRLVLVLILPATAGLFVLAHPIVALLFQRGEFTAYDTEWTARALRWYLLGLPFAAIDQPLVFGFYARQNTTVPALVGAIAVGMYTVIAISFVKTYGMLALVAANSIQWMGHAFIMLWLTRRHVGSFRASGLLTTVLKAGVASCIMAASVALVLAWLTSLLPASLVGRLLVVALPALAGVGVYAVMVWMVRLDEARAAIGLVWQKMRK